MKDLKVQELKRELEERDLETSGNKAALQIRLRQALEEEGVVADEFSFEGECDITSLLGAVKEIQQKLQEGSDKFDKLDQRVLENSERLEESLTQNSNKIHHLEQKLLKSSITLAQKLQDRIETVEELAQKVQEDAVKQEEKILSEVYKILETYRKESGSANQVMRDSGTTSSSEACAAKVGSSPPPSQTFMKPPQFDGKAAWSAYFKQFEAAANANNWTSEVRATFLTLSLRGDAAEVLDKLSKAEQGDYESLVKHLEMRYGRGHLKQVYRSQLKARRQRSNESLTEFEFDVSRLSRLAWPDVDQDTLEQLTVDAFLDGLQDREVKVQVTLSRPTKIVEALARALDMEAVKTSCRTQAHVRQLDEDDDEDLVCRLEELIAKRKAELRCWKCGELGHVRSRCKNGGKAFTSSPQEN